MKKWALTLAVIGALNFAAFAVCNIVNGGTASAGKIENGIYYLGDHGKYFVTTEQVFKRSKFHATTLWVTHPLAFFGIVIFGALKTNEDEERLARNKREHP